MKIESINIWKRANDSRFSACMTLRESPSTFNNGEEETLTKRVRKTSTNSNLSGFEEIMLWITQQKEKYAQS